MEASLRRAVAEIGEARLLESLQAKNAPVKGIAIQEPERLSDRDMKATGSIQARSTVTIVTESGPHSPFDAH